MTCLGKVTNDVPAMLGQSLRPRPDGRHKPPPLTAAMLGYRVSVPHLCSQKRFDHPNCNLPAGCDLDVKVLCGVIGDKVVRETDHQADRCSRFDRTEIVDHHPDSSDNPRIVELLCKWCGRHGECGSRRHRPSDHDPTLMVKFVD